MVPATLETVKTATDVASNLVTIGAVLVGAVWAYLAFVRERTRWPKANLKLELTDRRLTDDQALLHVKVDVHNAGRGLMTLREMRVFVYRVLPLDGGIRAKIEDGELIPQPARDDSGGYEKQSHFDARWSMFPPATRHWSARDPELDDEPEVEPGENEEFSCDFLLPAELETVFVYVYVRNVEKRGKKEMGWTVTDYHDLVGGGGRPAKASPGKEWGASGGPIREFYSPPVEALRSPMQQSPREDTSGDSDARG